MEIDLAIEGTTKTSDRHQLDFTTIMSQAETQSRRQPQDQVQLAQSQVQSDIANGEQGAEPLSRIAIIDTIGDLITRDAGTDHILSYDEFKQARTSGRYNSTAMNFIDRNFEALKYAFEPHREARYGETWEEYDQPCDFLIPFFRESQPEGLSAATLNGLRPHYSNLGPNIDRYATPDFIRHNYLQSNVSRSAELMGSAVGGAGNWFTLPYTAPIGGLVGAIYGLRGFIAPGAALTNGLREDPGPPGFFPQVWHRLKYAGMQAWVTGGVIATLPTLIGTRMGCSVGYSIAQRSYESELAPIANQFSREWTDMPRRLRNP